MQLPETLKFKTIVTSPNLAAKLGDEALTMIGQEVLAGFSRDLSSRSEWEQRSQDAIKLALQVKEVKSFPWTGCSNVKFPLLTIAALQFLARVSVMVKGDVLTKVTPLGPDVDGKKALQAQRISSHISLQLNEEDTTWHDQDEQAKMAASIIGCSFKKTVWDPISGHVHSTHVPAAELVLDYHTKDIDKAGRVTHILSLSKNALQERVRQGIFCKLLEGSESVGAVGQTLLQTTADQTQGLQPEDLQDYYPVLEQHTWLDLDGDGYCEPYIVSVRKDTGQVLRIVARFFDEGDVHRKFDAEVRRLEQGLREMQANEGDVALQSRVEKEITRLEDSADNHILRIDPVSYFTRYLFIPSPDGGVYGLGLGSLIAPMNESVNSLVNQLIDGGTMANTAGGFLGRGVKIKAGTTAFDPFEWKPVDSSGDDLRKNIFPLPVREPSAVLFQLLGTLITYSEKISGATDIMTGGAPGQNTPAETSRNTVEQGMMLFSGIYNRMYRGFRAELGKFMQLNQLYLTDSPQYYELTEGPNALIAKDDYRVNTFRIFPAASAEAVSQSQRKQKAKELLDLALAVPGFNRYLAVKEYLEVCGYEGISKLYPDPAGPDALPVPQNPKTELEKAKLQQTAKEHEDSMQLAVAELKSQMELNSAKILELQAKAQSHIAQAEGMSTGHEIALIEAQIGAARSRQDGLLKALDLLQKSMAQRKAVKQKDGDGNDTHNAGLAGMGQ